MSNEFPPIPDEPWGRLWLPLKNWLATPGREEGFVSSLLTGPWLVNLWANSPESRPRPLKQVFEDTSPARALVLLGRPDAGKSHELRKLNGELPHSVLIEAKTIAEPFPQHLDRVVNNHSDDLTLLFDSLDESLIREANTVGSLAAWLKRRDARLGTAATRLVLSCRWADWPESTLQAAIQQWAGETPSIHVLLPLAEDDARKTALWVLKEQEDAFWKELQRRKLGWLACWPLAFLTMLRMWHDSGSLPASPRVLIDRLVSESLLVTQDRNDLTRNQRNPRDKAWIERVAGRTAAAMFFCGKSAFTGNAIYDFESLSYKDLLGSEKWETNVTLRPVVDRDLGELASRTSLLRPVPGTQNLVFHSQVVQETLAARWLYAQKLSLERLTHLFSKTGTGVFPQLRALAAALAEQHPEFRQWLLDHDPAVLLLADHTSLADSEKREIVQALLDYSKRILVVDSSVWQGHLSTLNHAGLPEQLRHWLSDLSNPPSAAYVAVEIASKAKPSGAADMLWEALPKWSDRVKVEMARAIVDAAPEPYSPDWRERWRSVIREEIETDSDGVLIAHALKAMIPDHMPVREAVKWLVLERQFSVVGMYSFFHWKAGQHLAPEDLPTVLDFMTKEQVFYLDHSDRYPPFKESEGVVVSAIRMAFGNLETPEVRDALERYWAALMNHTAFGSRTALPDLREWEKKFSLSEANRRNFAAGFLRTFKITLEDSMYSVFQSLLLDPGSDGPWLLEMIPQAVGTLAANLPQFARKLFPWTDFRRQHSAPLLKAWKASPVLQEMVPADPGHEGPFPRLDRQHESAARMRMEQEAKHKATVTIRSRDFEAKWLRQLHEMGEAAKQSHHKGDLAWPRIYNFLLFTHCGQSGGLVSHRYALPPGSPESWIADAATRYLLELPPVMMDNHSGMLAQFALTWLGIGVLENAKVLAMLESVWLPGLVAGVYDGHPEWMPAGVDWLDRFPAQEESVFRHILHKRYSENNNMSFLPDWRSRWKEKHTEELRQLLEKESVRSAGAGFAWLFLAQQNFTEALQLMEGWLHAFLSPSCLDDPAPTTPPPQLPTFQTNTDAQDLVWGLAFVFCRGRVSDQLEALPFPDDERLTLRLQTALQSWSRWAYCDSQKHWPERLRCAEWESEAIRSFAEILWRVVPNSERRMPRVACFVTWKHDAVDIRNAAVTEAQSRGLMVTPPAEDEGHVPWLQHEAEHRRLAREWHPFKPADFFHYAVSLEARFARDNGQFLDCVLEALPAWESTLQKPEGQGHLMDFRTGKFHDEPVISKGLKDWLKQNLKIIGGSESQPFQTSDERLDVLLEWPIPQWNETRSLVIEVKKDTYRSRHKSLLTEMENQLLRTYLEPLHRDDESITHGLYLVVWVSGARDDQAVSRKISELLEKLEAQARKLSKPPFVIVSKVIDARPAAPKRRKTQKK